MNMTSRGSFALADAASAAALAAAVSVAAANAAADLKLRAVMQDTGLTLAQLDASGTQRVAIERFCAGIDER
jgi:hypothetical protein